jgi:hypothetical protein
MDFSTQLHNQVAILPALFRLGQPASQTGSTVVVVIFFGQFWRVFFVVDPIPAPHNHEGSQPEYPLLK